MIARLWFVLSLFRKKGRSGAHEKDDSKTTFRACKQGSSGTLDEGEDRCKS